jgi:conjugative transfer signal peptidase TraF
LVILVGLKVSDIGINLTESLPVGFYHIEPVWRAVRPGDLVETCVPRAAERFAIARRYVLTGGPCPFGSIYFLKMVAAAAGDTVDLTDSRITVNGVPLPNSATFATDRNGAPLPHVPRGVYHLKPGELWLWTPNPRSWDSRYYGIVPTSNVAGFEHLLFAIKPWPYLDGVALSTRNVGKGSK